METACHILGWVLLGVAAAIALFMRKLSRDHPKQSLFKKLDREIIRGGLTIAGLTATIGVLIIWFTWPGA
ncbi:MAG: hypothetical protein WD768_17975 [Phycisphaeraceae bacterium]